KSNWILGLSRLTGQGDDLETPSFGEGSRCHQVDGIVVVLTEVTSVSLHRAHDQDSEQPGCGHGQSRKCSKFCARLGFPEQQHLLFVYVPGCFNKTLPLPTLRVMCWSSKYANRAMAYFLEVPSRSRNSPGLMSPFSFQMAARTVCALTRLSDR